MKTKKISKQLISVLLALLMIMTVTLPASAVFAADGIVKTVAITSEADLENKINSGYAGLSDKLIGDNTGNCKKTYTFTLQNDAYVFINVFAQSAEMNSIGGLHTYLYSSNLTKQYYHKYFSGSLVATGNTLTYLTKGTYALYIDMGVKSGSSTEFTANIGTLPSNTKFVTAKYIGTSGNSVKLQINTLDKYEALYISANNYGDCGDAVTTVGNKYTVDKNGYVTVPLYGAAYAKQYGGCGCFVNIGIEDVYGILHTTYYGILCDLTLKSIDGVKNSYTYTGKEIKPNNYTVVCAYNTTPDFKVSYKNNTNVGTATMTFTGTGNWIGSVSKTFKINAINAKNTSVKLSKTSYTYDGKAKKPSVTVKNGSTTLKNGTDYTVTYSSGRKNVGKYDVTIKFKGNYSGISKRIFTIKPKSTSISKLTAKKKGFTVNWKKRTTQMDGYQIQYATNSSFSKDKKTVNVSKKKTSYSASKLKTQRTYYVRVRTYKTVKVNGKSTKIYSSWSKVKTVKTKK